MLGDAAPLHQRWPAGIDLLIVDHYELDERFESACRPWARAILVIDDLANRRHDADFLLDQTLGRSPLSYAHLLPAQAQFLLGPDHALLRPQFAAARDRALARRGAVHLGTVLVSTGATDPIGLTGRVLTALARSQLALDVDVVVGPGDATAEELLRHSEGILGEVRIHRTVADMASLMISADLAIGACGVTSWERCCLGLPTIAILTADNQAMVAKHLADAGAIQYLGDERDLDLAELASALRGLATDPQRLAAMSTRAAAICDGSGVDRVVATVERAAQQ